MNRSCTLWALLAWTCAIPLIARAEPTTSLRGIVSSLNGSAVPDAIAKLTNTASGTTRQALTSPSGEYRFLNIPAGDYKLVVEQAGFSTLIRSDIHLVVDTPAVIDLQMGPASTEAAEAAPPATTAPAAPPKPAPQGSTEFQPTLSVGAGIQTSFQHTEPTGARSSDQFALGHARLYVSADITPNVSAMLNTEYNSFTNNMGILDAVGEIHASPKFNIWFGRFLPPSDRANLYGPFYSHQWGVYTDGIQDGYPFVFQGRDNGAVYWGDFKAGKTQVKVSVGGFDGSTATGDPSVLGAARVQLDFWDPENGYYLNGTYYGDKNILALGAATQWQSGNTATTLDFLLERKLPNNKGAVSFESEYSNYNRLGGYNPNYGKSQGAYALAGYIFPKKVGIGTIEVLGKYAIAEFTQGIKTSNPSYRQNTAEVNVNYLIKQFDARVMTFFRNASFNGVDKDSWAAGVGLQLQLSKSFHF